MRHFAFCVDCAFPKGLLAKDFRRSAFRNFTIRTCVYLFPRGVLVFILEALAFAFYFGKKYWKVFFGIGAVLILSLLISSAVGRFAFDASASNRIDIWLAGLKLFLGNPLGVGLGNSGEIASAFLLPEDIEIRSLVNSHLTLLCEFGFIVGALWISLIFTR